MANIETNEVKLFSAQSQDKDWSKALVKSSRSAQDAQLRKGVYGKLFSQFNELKEAYKQFSGYTEIPLLSNQYFNATMASFVRSFAGFLSIERLMDQPTALLYFMDLLGVTDNRIVLPNIGPENLKGINGRFSTGSQMVAGTTSYSISTGKKLIPGSVVLTLVHAADPSKQIIIRDDREGNLLAPAGILEAGTVDYKAAGRIDFTVGAGFTIAANDSYSIVAYEDVAGTPDWNGTAPGNNRFKMDMKNIMVTSEPDMLVAENNLMAMAAMQKAIGVNPQDVSGAKLTELYTKLINQKLVQALIRMHEGNILDFDLTGQMSNFHDFRSGLDLFSSCMVDVDTALAKKSVKGVKATAYVVGEKVANQFRKLADIGVFVDNTDSTYINDLLGYYKGVPVLRHMDVGENEGYAVHKTADGQLAPTIRGIYLPLTNTPMIGNYNNPTQVAQGIYYQEANEPIVPELVQKFTLEL